MACRGRSWGAGLSDWTSLSHATTMVAAVVVGGHPEEGVALHEALHVGEEEVRGVGEGAWH